MNRVERKYFCDRDCNHCKVINTPNFRQVNYVLEQLYLKFGNDVYEIVEHTCPNMTVCYDCRVDDFCHIAKEDNDDECGCEIANDAERVVKELS